MKLKNQNKEGGGVVCFLSKAHALITGMLDIKIWFEMVSSLVLARNFILDFDNQGTD